MERRRGRQQRESWFSERVGPLLSKMVEAIVIERPDNPRAWIVDYVDQGKDRATADVGNSRTVAGSGGRIREGESHRGSPDHNVTAVAPAPPAVVAAAPADNGANWAAASRSPPPADAKTPASNTTPAGSGVDASSACHEEKVEADTEDPEEIADMNALLLPSGSLPLDVERFSVSYSKAILAGWVKQGSPCCAAASVAGAWNALGGTPRGTEGAFSSDSVLRAMRDVVECQIADMIARFERLLGGRFDPLLRALETELALEGKHLGGRGSKATVANGPHLLRLTRSVTLRERERAGHSPTFDLLWDLYEDERMEAADAAEAARKAAATEAVARAISEGTVAATAERNCGGAGRVKSKGTHKEARGTSRGDEEASSPAHVSSAVGEVVGEGVGRSATPEAEEYSVGGRYSSGKTGVESCSVCSISGSTSVAADGAGNTPRRPSTGRSRAGGVAGNSSSDCIRGSTLRRPRSASDLARRGSSTCLGGEVGQELGAVRHCWEDGNGSGVAGGARRASGIVEREYGEVGEGIEDNEVDEEEPEEEDAEEDDDETQEGGGPEEELGVGVAPDRRRRSSNGCGSRNGKRHCSKRKHRRKSAKKCWDVRRSTGAAKEGGGKGAAAPGREAAHWRWKEDLCTLLKRMGGLEKLCAKSPSTGAIGNLGLISTVRYMDGEASGNVEVTARLFMGKGGRRCSGIQVPLSARDGEDEKAKQWAALREAFMNDRQVLIFHLTNHYALIFALREWFCPPPSSPSRLSGGSSGSTKDRSTSDAAANSGRLACPIPPVSSSTTSGVRLARIRANNSGGSDQRWASSDAGCAADNAGGGGGSSGGVARTGDDDKSSSMGNSGDLTPSRKACSDDAIGADLGASVDVEAATDTAPATPAAKGPAAIGVDVGRTTSSGAAATRGNIQDGRASGRGGVGSRNGGDSSSAAGSAGVGWTRQMLTSRRGQRPSVWIDFEEARKILLGWEGYMILSIESGKGRVLPA